MASATIISENILINAKVSLSYSLSWKAPLILTRSLYSFYVEKERYKIIFFIFEKYEKCTCLSFTCLSALICIDFHVNATLSLLIVSLPNCNHVDCFFIKCGVFHVFTVATHSGLISSACF